LRLDIQVQIEIENKVIFVVVWKEEETEADERTLGSFKTKIKVATLVISFSLALLLNLLLDFKLKKVCERIKKTEHDLVLSFETMKKKTHAKKKFVQIY
jgi:hypothetical protein